MTANYRVYETEISEGQSSPNVELSIEGCEENESNPEALSSANTQQISRDGANREPPSLRY